MPIESQGAVPNLDAIYRSVVNLQATSPTAAQAAALQALVSGAWVMRVPPPAGFSRMQRALIPAVYKSGASYWTTVSPSDYIDAACMAGAGYHVDPINGNDANGGTGAFDGDFSGAFRTLGKAITAGNASAAAYRIIFPGGDAAPVTYDVNSIIGGGGSYSITQSVMIFAIGKHKAILSTHSDPASWSLDTGTTYSAQIPVSSATYPIGRVLDMANLNAHGYWSDMALAANAAACRATPGSYFVDTAATPYTVYINRSDGAAVTPANSRVFVKKSFFAASSTFSGAKVMYVENVGLHGGISSGQQIQFHPTTSTGVFAAQNVEFGYSASGSTGLGAQSGKLAIMKDWKGYAMSTDPFSVHDTANTGTAAISINGYARDIGRSGSNSNNAFTVHDGVTAIDINPNYSACYGGCSAHVSTTVGASLITQVWSLGGYIGPSLGSPGDPTTLNDSVWSSSADMWIDGATIEGNAAGYAISIDKNQLPSHRGAIYLRDVNYVGTTRVASGCVLGAY